MIERNYFKLTDDDFIASFNVNYNLNEAKVGTIYSNEKKKKGKINIYIKGRETGEPHMHLEDDSEKEVVRIKIETAEYQRDAYDKKSGKRIVLTSDEENALNEFLHSKDDNSSITNWEYIAMSWNKINSDNLNKVNIQKILKQGIPVFLNIKEPK